MFMEREAKMEAVQKCRDILECNFKSLPKYTQRNDEGRIEVSI